MSKLSVAGAALILSLAASGALAANHGLDAAFGNTVQVDIQGVWSGKMYIDPDGTFTQDTTDGKAKGTWKTEGDKNCFYPEGGQQTCSPATPHKVGETWENTDSNGVTSTVKIVAGRP